MADMTFLPVAALARQQPRRRAVTAHKNFMVYCRNSSPTKESRRSVSSASFHSESNVQRAEPADHSADFVLSYDLTDTPLPARMRDVIIVGVALKSYKFRVFAFFLFV